jgi:mono/diheme cytochrome c family protein
MNIRHLLKAGMILASLTVFIATLTFSTAVSANQKKGNQAKGRYYFRQTCKTCHVKGAPGGEVTPMSKTMAQWKRYFESAKHKKGAEALAQVMAAEQITDVGAYLVEHAADSLQPETCGK